MDLESTLTVNAMTSVSIEDSFFQENRKIVENRSIDHRTQYFANTISRTYFSSESRNEVSKCSPQVIEIGSGRMGALSDYICKSNEAVDKMVEIYIHKYIPIYNVYICARVCVCARACTHLHIYIYKIMD